MLTGKVSYKVYKCTTCDHVHSIQTNHYGETYGRCPKCSWKNPLESNRHICIEPLPEGWTRPEPWDKVVTGKTIEQICQDALAVQSACNLGAVAMGLHKAVNELRDYQRDVQEDYGTFSMNTHPVVIVWMDKMNSLCGLQELGNETVMRAFDWVSKKAEG